MPLIMLSLCLLLCFHYAIFVWFHLRSVRDCLKTREEILKNVYYKTALTCIVWKKCYERDLHMMQKQWYFDYIHFICDKKRERDDLHCWRLQPTKQRDSGSVNSKGLFWPLPLLQPPSLAYISGEARHISNKLRVSTVNTGNLAKSCETSE